MMLHTMPIITGPAREKLPAFLQERERMLERVKARAIEQEVSRRTTATQKRRAAAKAAKEARARAAAAAAAARRTYVPPPPDPDADAHRACLEEELA